MGSMSSPVIHHDDEYRDLAGQKVLGRSYMASSRKLSDPKVKLMSSYGGKILPRPSDNKLRYAGGDTRMISVSRFIRFNDLESKMNEIYGPNLTIKYQLPEEDLDALVTVSSDEDLENMMDEYDRLDASEGPSSSRLRLFVFASSDGDSIDLHDISDPRISEQQYVDAVNALQIDAPFRRNGDMLSATSSKNLDDWLQGWDPLPVHDGLQSSENLQFPRLYPAGKPSGFANSPANSNPLHSSSGTAALSRQHSDSSDFAANWHANNLHAVPLTEATRADHAEAVSRKLSDMHLYAHDSDAGNSLTGAATREEPLRSLSKKVSNPLPDFTSDWCANSPPIGVEVRKDHLEASLEFAGSSRPINDPLDALSRNLSDSPKFATHRNAYTHTIGETIGLNKALSSQESGSSEFASNLHANASNISPISGTIREDTLEPFLRNHPDSPQVASNWNADANANDLPIGRIIGSGQVASMQRSNSSPSEVPSNKHLEAKRFLLSGVSRENLSEVVLRQLSGASVATSNWHADANVSPITKVAIEVPFGTFGRQISGSSEFASNWNANKNVLPVTKVTRDDALGSFSSDVGSSVPVNANENRDAPPVGTVIGANLLDREFGVSNLHVNSKENRDIPSIGAVIGANILDREAGGSASSSTSSQYGLHYSPSLHHWNPSPLMQPLGEAVSYANGEDTLNKGDITSPGGQVPTVGILDMSAILQTRSTDMHMKTDVIPIVDENDKSYPDMSEAIPLSPGAILQKQLEIDRCQNLDVTSTEGLQTLISKMEELHEQPKRNVWTQIDSSASPHLIPDLLSASPQMDDLLSEFIPTSATGHAASSSEAGRRGILENPDLFSTKTETDLEKAFPHSSYMSALHSPVASGAALEQGPVTQGLSAKVVLTHNRAHELAEQSLAYVTDYTASLNHSTAAVWGNSQTPPQLASHYGLSNKGLDLNEVPLNAAADVDVTLEQSDVAPTLEDDSTVAMPLLSKVGGSNLPSSQGMEPEESVSLSPLTSKVGSLKLSSPYRADPDENVSVPATKLYPYSLATDTGGFSRTNAASVASHSDKLTINLSKPSSLVDLSSTGIYENRFVTADRMNKDVLTEDSEEVEHSGGSDMIHVKTEIVVGGDEEDRPVAGEEPLPPLAFHAPASMIDVWSTTRSQYEQDVTVPPVNLLEDVDEKSDTEEIETFQSAVGTINDTVVKPKKVAATAGKDPIALNLQTILYSDLEELRELGSGTFGTVYHGKWRGTDVAIKRIKSTCFTGRPSERGRMISDFWQEAKILGQLHHPNVVAFYGIVPHGPDGTLATVTEFMVNGSLKQALQKKDRILDRRKRLLIAMDAAFGMEYLHGKNIVHFDLKCDNLLVNLRDIHRPICKVGDLGLSKIKQQTMISGGVRGTLPWMAPELLNGSSSLVSEKVDVFSFGIVLWEILTGEEPYADMHYGAIIGGIVSNTLRPPVPRWCDATYRALMEACWSADPSERPSFSEIARSLRSMEAALAAKGRAQSPISGQD